jgi:hypothetical protein
MILTTATKPDIENILPHMKTHCNPRADPAFGAQMVTEIIMPALSDVGSLGCLLLAACRQMIRSAPANYRDFFERLIAKYRLMGVRALSAAIRTLSSEGDGGTAEKDQTAAINEKSVFQAVFLATDEV